MNVPTFQDVPWTDKDGNLTPQIQLYNDELNQALQNGLSDNGWTVPGLTTLQIQGPNAPPTNIPNGVQAMMPVGTIWFDTTLKKLYVKTDVNTVQQIQSV